MSLREELIQVAAVAVAIVQDLDYGTTANCQDPETGYPNVFAVVEGVVEERHAQEVKWGPQHHSPEEWLAILAEEVGEAARELPLHDFSTWDRVSEFPMTEVYQNNVIWALREAERTARLYLKRRFG